MINKILISLSGVFFLPFLAIASANDFNIKTIVGEDTTPPTTPVMLSAVVVDQNQIDVSWSASTDNFSLSGYVLHRDGQPLATTSLTSFSDTGLTAETLYTYDVYAFDSSNNVSTTSNSLSTTTLATPPPPAVSTSSGSTQDTSNSTSNKVDSLGHFEISTTFNSANIKWTTNQPTKYVLRWGRYDDYEGGYIVNEIFNENHETLITDLEPGTVYLYELKSVTPGGVIRVLKEGQFKTKETKVILAPPNVQHLKADVVGNDVSLSWQFPPNLHNAKVRVVRNYLGYPSNLFDGALVYEGNGTQVSDKDALSSLLSQFYTVFVIDQDGNVSSGAVVRAEKNEQDHTGKINDKDSSSTPALPSEEGYFEEVDDVISEFGFDRENIILKQGEVIFTFADENIYLYQNEPFTISIPYNSLPKHLKSIVVTLLDPTDHRRSYSFLLRINKDRTAYEATIAPLNVVGISRLQVEIFDFERNIVGLYRKQINFTASKKVSKEVIFPDKIAESLKGSFPILSTIILILLILLLLLWLRSRKTEDNR